MASQITPVRDYALGYTQTEQDRLIRQATRIAPLTERLFREAGISRGQRVLDLGSGIGDVSMIVARLVGPSGHVLGIERDASSIARACARVAALGLHNVEFTQCDVCEISGDHPFDAAVGRFILMFLPDPLSVLRSVSAVVRPGGVLAFQEPTWIPLLAFSEHLPLLTSLHNVVQQTFRRAGVNPEMGPALHSLFPKASLPVPHMWAEFILGADPELIDLRSDLVLSIRPLAEQHGVSLDPLGDLDTLAQRIQEEVDASASVVSFVPLVSAWARKHVA
jgi:ubiquinone/menaquinone biosynthesis C-methylase UbiE